MPISPKELVLAFLGGVGCFAALVGWDALGVGSFNCPQRENFMLEVFSRLEYIIITSKKGGVCSLFVWIFLFFKWSENRVFLVWTIFWRLGVLCIKRQPMLGQKMLVCPKITQIDLTFRWFP